MTMSGKLKGVVSMLKIPPKWFVRRRSDGRILCIDRKWRLNVGCVDQIKFYSSDNRAHRYGLKGQDGSALAVHSDDRVDCTGEVYYAQNV